MPENIDFTLEQLTGQAVGHVREVGEPRCTLHREAVTPFLAMRAAAAADGIDLVAFSSFRDFDRQLAIWNGKFRGERALLDHDSRPVDVRTLNEEAIVRLVGAILLEQNDEWPSSAPAT